MMLSPVGGRYLLLATAVFFSSYYHHIFKDDSSSDKSRANAEKLSTYTPAAQWDHIAHLPGLGFDPSFLQFSGYLTVSESHGRRIFYWYVESQGDPDSDPLVLWTNGGPGCSGLLGFGTEHGPFFVGPKGTLSPNPYSWNKLANVLYVEQPAGVGFSYSETESDYDTGDEQAAVDNYVLIHEFLKRFPERRSNEFYIASESYGGHYMPQLTKEILNRNTDGNINFKGMMVGNPYVDPFTNTIATFDAFYSHGLVPRPIYVRWQQLCQNMETYQDGECDLLTELMFRQAGSGINPYAMDFPVCNEDEDDVDSTYQKQTASIARLHGEHVRIGGSSLSSQVWKLMNHSSPPSASPDEDSPPLFPADKAEMYKPCAEQYLHRYLNRLDVREAIHVDEAYSVVWDECTMHLNYSDYDRDTPQVDLYKELVRIASQQELHILVFSGDDDSICSTASTQYWIWDLGVSPQKRKVWKPWKNHDQTAGFVTKFDLGDDAPGSFTFATVHGAGHEVPAYRPSEALKLFENYLSHKW